MSVYAIDNVGWFRRPPAGEIGATNTATFDDLREGLHTTAGGLVADVDALLNPVDRSCPIDPPIGASPPVATVRG